MTPAAPEKTKKSLARRPKPKRWLPITAGLVVAGVGIAAGLVWRLRSPTPNPSPTPVVVRPQIRSVVALGRLTPKGEVIKLSAPTSAQENRIERLLVAEGDLVRAGQVIAILDAQPRLQADLAEAQARVEVAQSKLAVVRAGAKQGELNAQSAEIARIQADWQGNIAAQSAKIARLKAELANAQTDYERNQSLFREGAISASQRDSNRLTRDVAQRSLEEAQLTLTRSRANLTQELNKARSTFSRIAEVRPVDVREAQAEVTLALAALRQAQARLDQTLVRSPIAGEVLDIYTRAGEVVGTNGIAEIGQTRKMQVIAEVYQTDVRQLRLGQTVQISSDALPNPLTGTVALIGSQVRRQNIINTDPSSNIDARVVEVWIALDPQNSQQAAKFTNLQVKVVIQK
jgi:HlyD family secretion protein